MKKLLVFLAFFFIFCLSFQVVIDTDYAWHLRVGQYILKTRSIPTHDLFSFSVPNYPYVYYEWGSEVTLAAVYKIAGNFGVSFFYALLSTFTIYFIYGTAKVIDKKKPFLPIFVLFAPVAYAVGGGRVRSFGFLLLALVYFLFCKFIYKKSKLIWVVPLVFVLWVNLHGSFVLGIGTFAVFSILIVAFKRDLSIAKTLAIVNILSLGATFCNPYSLKVWRQVLLISANYSSGLQYINLDWQSLLIKESGGWIFALFAFLLIVLLFLVKNKIELWQKLLLIIFLILSLKSARFAVGLFIFFLIPLNQIVGQFKEGLVRRKIDTYFLSFVMFLILLILFLGSFINILEIKYSYSSVENYTKFLRAKFPKKYTYMNWPYAAGLFVSQNLKDKRVLNEANWGSLLLLLDPELKVFYYGAMDNFIVDGKSFTLEYLSIVNASGGWQGKLRQYSINAVFLPPNFPLVESLKNDPHWKNVYEDKEAVVLIKT